MGGALSDFSLHDNAVGPLDQPNENCGISKFRSPLIQVGFRNPTGAGAEPSSKNGNVLVDKLLQSLGERRPADRNNGAGSSFAHEISGFAKQENLNVGPASARARACTKGNEARVESSEPQALFIMIFKCFFDSGACVSGPRNGKENSCARNLRRAMFDHLH
jgi:hypothetical protein